MTITDLEAGREYETFMLAESAFGRNSSRVSFVRSLYTDTVSLNNTLSTHRLQTQVHFESGVGSTVQMDLDCSDFPLSWTQNQLFALALSEKFVSAISIFRLILWHFLSVNPFDNLQKNILQSLKM